MSSKLFCKIHEHLASAPSLRASKQLSWFHCQWNECPRTVLYKLSRMIKGLAGRHYTPRMTVWSSFPYVHAVLHSMLNVHWEARAEEASFPSSKDRPRPCSPEPVRLAVRRAPLTALSPPLSPSSAACVSRPKAQGVKVQTCHMWVVSRICFCVSCSWARASALTWNI